MKAILLALSVPLFVVGQSVASAEDQPDPTLPPRVARLMQGVTLTAQQQASMQALKREFDPKLADARRRIAAHELAKWRLGLIDRDFHDRVAAILTTAQRQAHLLRALHGLTQIEFVETPLYDVVDYLQDLHHIPIVIDRTALRAAKKDADLPITGNIRGVSLDSALRLILRQEGLMLVLQGDKLLITTEEEGRRLLQRGAADPAALPSPPRDAAAKRLAAVLRKPTEMEFVETPLKDVVDYLKDLHRVEIQLDDCALRDAGVDGSTPVTLKLKGVTLDAGLKKLLDKLGLKYVIQDEVILITADPPAKPLPVRPAADNAEAPGWHPLPVERAIVERLEDLCTSCRLSPHKGGEVAELAFDSPLGGDEVLALATKLDGLQMLFNEDGDPVLSGITDRGLAHLRNARRLTKLELHGEKITDAGVANLAGLTQLRMLKLGETDISDEGVKHFIHLRDLQELSLDGTRVDGSGFAELPKMGDLEELGLNDTQMVDGNLKYLARFPNLKVLRLGCTRIDGSGLEAVASLPRLKELVLYDSRVSDAGLGHLRGAVALESLSLHGTPITDAGLRRLAELPSLQTLDLSDTRITDAWLKSLAALPHLNTLDLSRTAITDAGLVHLQELKNLTTLRLNGTVVTDACLPTLRKIPRLSSVSALNSNVSANGLSKLQREFSIRDRKAAGGQPGSALQSDDPFGPSSGPSPKSPGNSGAKPSDDPFSP